MQRRNARHGTYQTRAFDASGRNVSFENKYKVRAGRNLYNTVTRDLKYDYDGDGHQVRQRVYVNGTQQMGETKYQIWSSVLGMFISETNQTGAKVTTKVTANGSVIAEQLNYAGTNDDVVTWIHADPVSGSSSRTHKDGTLWYRTEYEPLGQEINVFGTDEEFPDPPDTGSTSVAADDPQWQCQVSALMNESFFLRPVHCQRAQIENAGFFEIHPWVEEKEKTKDEETPFYELRLPGMDVPFAPSENVLSFAKRATDKKNKDEDEDGSFTCDPDDPECQIATIKAELYKDNPIDAASAEFGGEFLLTLDQLKQGARKVIENALKDNPKGPCAKLVGKEAIEKFDKVAKDIEINGKVEINHADFGIARLSPLEILPRIAAVTEGQKIYLNPNGLAFRKFAEGKSPLQSYYSKLGVSQEDYAYAVIIHEFLHTTKKFKADSVLGLDGNYDSSLSVKYQEQVLKDCFGK